jgi:hypothetical protein
MFIVLVRGLPFPLFASAAAYLRHHPLRDPKANKVLELALREAIKCPAATKSVRE